MTQQDIMNAEEVAEVLGFKTPETLYDNRWRKKTGIPLFKQGKRLFAYSRAFDKWYKGRIQYV